MAKIKAVEGQEILNAKGFPTIEATVILNDGKIGTASCPRGEKIGHYEAVDLEDNDESRFEGQGISKAIGNINTIIAPALIGKDAERQPEIDRIMIDLDGTQNKSRIGANAMLAVSMAVAKAAAESSVFRFFFILGNLLRKIMKRLKSPFLFLTSLAETMKIV